MWGVFRVSIMAAAFIAVAGCQAMGPKAIDTGRGRYNGAIQSTAMEQTLSNIVRVYKHEPIQYMDVSEINATMTVRGILNGSVGNIGSGSGAAGTTGGSLEYSEMPVVRYVPVASKALVAQLATPISVDALGLLYDSFWDIAPLLDFSTSYLTLDTSQSDIALNTIIELSDLGVLQLTAARADPIRPGAAKSRASDKADSDKASSDKPNNALVLYLRPFHASASGKDLADKTRALQLWVRLLRIYGGTQPVFNQPRICKDLSLSLDRLAGWDVNIARHIYRPRGDPNTIIDKARKCLPDEIQLRIVPLPASESQVVSHAPLMRTYSALGILRMAAERPDPKIEFVEPEMYDRIRANTWNRINVGIRSFYTLLPGQEDSVDCSEPQRHRSECGHSDRPSNYEEARTKVGQWIANWQPDTGALSGSYPYELFVYEEKGKDMLSDAMILANHELRNLRRYILIIVADRLPDKPVYASYFDGRRWYYIDRDDIVSEKNFQLIALFMTMMAEPPTTQPLFPVINVGG